jgi:hypothetical protein
MLLHHPFTLSSSGWSAFSLPHLSASAFPFFFWFVCEENVFVVTEIQCFYSPQILLGYYHSLASKASMAREMANVSRSTLAVAAIVTASAGAVVALARRRRKRSQQQVRNRRDGGKTASYSA